jgi:hypothetical protein
MAGGNPGRNAQEGGKAQKEKKARRTSMRLDDEANAQYYLGRGFYNNT